MDDLQNRRVFLRAAAAASVAWAAADLAQVEDALAWASHQAGTGGTARVNVLTKAQADAIDALTSRILPSVDGRPGAHEAGVVYFIDRALATFATDERAAFVEGLNELQKKTRKRFGKTKRFSDLSSGQQTELLKGIEKSQFFELVRTMTILGMFSNPEYGGNHDQIGWKLLGFEDQFHFKSPFGFYDAEYQSK